ILLDTAKSSRDSLRARALFAERLAHKAHSSWSWKGYGDILATLGQDERALEARARAAELVSGN
ncbi:MAG TPA: tetratricopeptide repeat protein, partial [Mesorhizobium sp.]